MNTKRLSLLALASVLSMTGCFGKDKTSESVSESETQKESESVYVDPYETAESVDLFGTIPEEVRNYSGSIDFLIYIEGQNGTYEDIGNPDKYPADKIPYIEMARYVGAARAFKEVCPRLKINLIYCSISEYNDTLIAYTQQKGHLPHLMWATDHVVEMMQNGYYVDLSEYKDTEYFQSFNDYLMSRFNYGGFQGGIPIAAEPWGVFVNLDTLDQFGIVNTKNEAEYHEWVDNFTYETMVETAKNTTTPTHAGYGHVVDYPLSYGVPTINEQFLKEGSVKLDTELVKDLLALENELCDYSAYDYSEGYFGNGQSAKTAFAGTVANWAGTSNFVEDEVFTFYAEAPWGLTTLSQYITEHENVDTRIDYLPYPKASEELDAYTGIAVEGIGVGNLCPIGESGEHECYSTTAKLEEEVAAYFAMFMSADYRSIRERANIEFIHDGTHYTGSLSLPLIKKGYKFSWEEDKDITDELGDYLEGYTCNYDYQMAKFFDIYSVYVTDGQPVDVDSFSNLTYGLTKILDTVYGDNVTTLNFWNEPVNIPDGTVTKDIFDKWQGRYETYSLGSQNYVSDCIAALADMEEEINQDVETAWELIQEMLDLFYEEGKYDVLDHSSRNNY